MYKNILVPIDPAHGDDQIAALRMAAHLGEDSNTTITALTVIEPVPAHVRAELPDEFREPKVSETAMARLRSLVGPNSEVRTIIRRGRPAHEIIEYARAENVDCIVLASHRPGFGDYFLGSNAARVVRHAPCSVHVMR